ncbi:FXYD domain containing ion transport regulator 6 like [Chanos chanos]|uniref:FXYD domain-containing ion transport regulator n=1 Tax=Chanos chanos TaxID=29144 RepID=A0A6J2W1I2_CHACN|nr:sodium/potassium-transporting ATPase subunit gamma-like [Chanos chanos]ASQ41638.1 FXYD8 [Chanos chanos]
MPEDMALTAAVAFCSCLAPVWATTMDDVHDYDSPFHYDYESLRIGGLIFAVALFLMGIFLVLSRKCRCSGRQQQKPVGMNTEAAGVIVEK